MNKLEELQAKMDIANNITEACVRRKYKQFLEYNKSHKLAAEAAEVANEYAALYWAEHAKMEKSNDNQT